MKRLTGRTFKVLNFKFVIHHGRIFFGKRPVKLTVSKNKRFPGYFTFTLNKVVYYIKFTLRGLIVYGVRGHKVFKTTVITHKKIVIKHPKKGKKEKKPKKGKKEKKPKKGKKEKKPKKGKKGKKPKKGKKGKKEKKPKNGKKSKKPKKGKKPKSSRPHSSRPSHGGHYGYYFYKRKFTFVYTFNSVPSYNICF